jgi:hypothetical protein
VLEPSDIGAVVAAEPRGVAAEYVWIGSDTAAADNVPGTVQPPFFNLH